MNADERRLIGQVNKPRTSWAAAFQNMAEHGDDALLDEPPPSLIDWDEDQWQW